MRKQIFAGCLLLTLCGCIKVKDELTLNADGSGKVRIETVSSLPPEFAEGLGLSERMGDNAIYPPVGEEEARKFFPEKDFTFTVKQEKARNGDITNIIEAEFQNLNTLLASPYGRAHQLTVKIADGSLVLRGVTGLEAAARFADVKNDSGFGYVPQLNAADLQKKKSDMRAEFRVTLPNAVSSNTGTRDGKSVAWIVERAKCKDDEDFARQLGAAVEAKCAADGLKMSPVSPARMGLLPFAQLADGFADAGANMDTNKIAAAAKFVPFGLTITRSVDLSGSGSSRENAAQLVGAVTVPVEFAPRKWGEPEITEIVDAQNNDLKFDESDEARPYQFRNRVSDSDGDDTDKPTNNVQKHLITIQFRPPDWSVGEILRINASVSLQYYGGSQVIKLTNAVPAKWIVDATNSAGGGFDYSIEPVHSPALDALGLSLSAQTGTARSGMTMLELQTKGKEAALTDAEVFDANGRPWPTFLQAQNSGGGDDAESFQLIIAGRPQPPLSLSLLVSGGGATVNVPILMEHVRISK